MKKGEEEANMKKIFSIIVGLILIFTITSCQNDKKVVENDVKDLIEFIRNGGYKLSNHDKMAGIPFEAIDEGYKKMSYKINKTKKENKNKKNYNSKKQGNFIHCPSTFQIICFKI